MSVFNLKSQLITNRDATPKVLSDGFQAPQMQKEDIGVERTSAPIIDAGSQMRLCIVPSSARLSHINYCNQGLGSSAAADVAVWYPTTISAGAGLSPALAATLISSSSFGANITGFATDTGNGWTDAVGTVANCPVNKRMQPLWQVLGLASDPNIDLDVGFTFRTATVTQGYVGMRVGYCD